MEFTTLAKNTTPLCFLPDGHLVCYRHGSVIVYEDGKEGRSYAFPMSKKERLLGRSRYASRLMRFGIRSAVALDNEHVLLSQGNRIFELDLFSETISNGWLCGDRIRPLIFTEVKDIEGITDGIYFGGYLGNNEKKPVNVYHRTGVDQWEVVYTFQHGAINHVHNIVSDPYRNCLWAFTGDFDEASAIWKITDNFKKVERIVCNDQKYRGCVVYALPEGLLYATDAPFVDDYIYLLNPETLETKELYPIHGSCIYGCQWKDKFVFSSTVEGDGRNMSILEWLFTRKRGAGIKDDKVHLYIGNLKEGFKEVFKQKKDFMPFYTFQFGVFKFPFGVNLSDKLYFQPIATKKHDIELLWGGVIYWILDSSHSNTVLCCHFNERRMAA